MYINICICVLSTVNDFIKYCEWLCINYCEWLCCINYCESQDNTGPDKEQLNKLYIGTNSFFEYLYIPIERAYNCVEQISGVN